MSQRARRADPYPWTWEIPVGVALVELLLLVLAVQFGRALANMASGGGWTFPSRVNLFTSVLGVLRGDSAAGLFPSHGPFARPVALSACVAAVVVVVLAVTVLLLRWGLAVWGPGRMRGMASRVEAEQLLGGRRLRRVASTVRLDLYGRSRR